LVTFKYETSTKL